MVSEVPNPLYRVRQSAETASRQKAKKALETK